MVFAHDTEVALASAAALVNTAHGDDQLAAADGLADFVREWQWSGAVTGDDAELAAVRRLRPELEAWWRCDRDELVDRVNDVLRRTHALPQLIRHDGWDYHLHATPPDAPLADRMAVEAAMAMVDVIRADEIARLQVCAADDCDDVLVDLTKNRSRRFCSTGCSNRTNVAAFRARRRQT
ncbi:CGNR zinc finger domain-containing protein [Nakamurella flava]|uniref:CGNR zinc finger domain-containing protein n=1 Tax=Nakamurella flava TaxID=2576308 RepID=A0A4V6CTR6_9ACTN|nr:CGNR zinc finger domain-containing protein [Nakamurella flava]TKV60825.1 CGNR zinc finger domain-containing protein [Nakamurella flava]